MKFNVLFTNLCVTIKLGDSMLNLRVPQYRGHRFWNLSTKDGSIIVNSTDEILVFGRYINYKMEYPFYINAKLVIANDFYDVLKYVFDYPIAFNLKKENEDIYSEEQLHFINLMKEKCIKDGLFNIKEKNRYVSEELQKRGYTHLFDEVKDYHIFEESIAKKIPQYHSDKKFKFYDPVTGELTTHYESFIFAFEDYLSYSLYYEYNVLNDEDHCHDFQSIVIAVFYYPDTFNITKKQKKYFSSVELTFIDRLLEKCKQDNLHDIEINDLYINDELVKRNMNHLIK